MRYRIKHVTTYSYQENVSLSQNHARLKPQNTALQQCLSHQITVSPEPDYSIEYQDYYNNTVFVFEIPTLHKTLVVTALSEVEILAYPQQSLFENQQPWEQVRQQLAFPSDRQLLQAAEYALPSPLTPASEAIKAFALHSFTPGRAIIEACNDLMARIFNEFTYDPGFSTLYTPVSEVLEHKKGVCQDFAHLALAALRSLGLAAKYVSGYIETVPPEGQEKLTGADATHAWFSLYVPGRGWLDFDPTNNLMPHQQHVTLASGRDFNDVTPLKGVMFGGGSNQLSVAVDMDRLE